MRHGSCALPRVVIPLCLLTSALSRGPCAGPVAYEVGIMENVTNGSLVLNGARHVGPEHQIAVAWSTTAVFNLSKPAYFQFVSGSLCIAETESRIDLLNQYFYNGSTVDHHGMTRVTTPAAHGSYNLVLYQEVDCGAETHCRCLRHPPAVRSLCLSQLIAHSPCPPTACRFGARHGELHRARA